jgi:DNA-binding transcriptional LysR family regulator
MPMFESLRSIQVFVATYEERSFTAAAKREHATQSGVSQHVRKLEERLGASRESSWRGSCQR